MPTFTDIEEDGKITIGFSYTDQLGNRYSSESSMEILYDMGENEVDSIGRQLDAFLRQCGYYRRGECILMESLTDEEFDAVTDYLDSYRADHDKTAEGGA